MEVIRRLVKGLELLLAVALCCADHLGAQEPGNPPPTFTKEVAPILQKHCQTCHRPGEAAPSPCSLTRTSGRGLSAILTLGPPSG